VGDSLNRNRTYLLDVKDNSVWKTGSGPAVFVPHRFDDVAEMRRRLAAHLHWYNHARTHHDVAGTSRSRTPA
jgi:hypothetical protein